MKTSTPGFLLIDIGNTRLKWAQAGLRGPVRVAGDITTSKATPQWITALARKYPERRVVLASVVPKLVPTFRRAFSRRLEVVTGASRALGLSFHYPKPAEIGADRIAAAVAAHGTGKWPVIIVSCGTATAFTVLDAKGRLCGGVIAPGLQTQLAALIGATAQLPATSLRQPRSALARSTQDAINVGVMLNFQGGVKEIIQQLSQSLLGRKKPHVILTGGNAGHLAGKLNVPFKLRPLLVFEVLLHYRTPALRAGTMNSISENRIDLKFRELKKRGQKAFVPYITAGDPKPETTPELVWALERAGADIVELGVPFSDPLADGIVNQLSAQRALEAGTTTQRVFEILKTIRTKSQVPLVLYTYFNLLYAYDIERFCADALAAGADGLLILDLPPEESEGADSLGAKLGDRLCRISLVAPTSPVERMAKIVQKASGFVYYVSREGVTGMQKQGAGTVGDRIDLLRKHTPLPICVGFGISTPEQARAAAQQADGAIVGSALVNRIAEWGKDPDIAAKLEAFARPLAEAIHS